MAGTKGKCGGTPRVGKVGDSKPSRGGRCSCGRGRGPGGKGKVRNRPAGRNIMKT